MIGVIADRGGQLELGMAGDEVADGAFLVRADLEDQVAAGVTSSAIDCAIRGPTTRSPSGPPSRA